MQLKQYLRSVVADVVNVRSPDSVIVPRASCDTTL